MGVAMNYESEVSNRYKYNLVERVLDRALKIHSSVSNFSIQIKFQNDSSTWMVFPTNLF